MEKNFYTIEPDIAFLDTLAAGLLKDVGGDTFRLSQSLILLPTRRACRHLRDAFLRHIKTRAALLPRMQPLGDIDEDEFYFADNEGLSFAIPPAISPLRRQMLLTQLISAKDQDIALDQAAQLAEALALFLDQVQIEQCDLSKLGALVAEKDLAEHWRETVKFLEILTEAWPAILAKEGCIDPADRRNHVLKAQTDLWRKTPPNYPIIAAGSTGTMPATADLLELISELPKGAVILPGLDQTLDEEAWQAITETHPQFNIKKLLEKCKVKRTAVKIWGEASARLHRAKLLQETMRPASVTEAWRQLNEKAIPKSALNGLTQITLDHPQEEAQTIALLLRAALETPDKTAALVTPDRNLAERVSALLKKWNIDANDSGGAALTSQPVGSFLLDLLSAASPHAGAVDYLTLLKHPYAACGLSPVDCRIKAREIEIAVWRNQRPEKSEWLDTFKAQLHPMASNWQKPMPLSERLEAHIRLAEQLAASDKETGADRLWKDETGEAAAEFLSTWREAASGFPWLTGEEYKGLFAKLLQSKTVRPNFGQHPRLSILGPLEARLIHADLVILGGCNESNWPPETEIDPWMSRPMKQAFGLPLPERRVGLSAHDFVQLACAPEVVLTRAKRAGNAPTVPSRFLLQLETVLHALGYENALTPSEPWHDWVRQLDQPATITPCDPPQPRPPASARPKKLSVTEIGTWRRNPYAIYARHILDLKKLEPLDADISLADRGTLIHAVLDQFIKQYPKILPPDARDILLAFGEKTFAVFDEYPEVKAFWWPRFERIADWFIENEITRRASGIYPLVAEARGEIALGNFTLHGRVDRIDNTPDGAIAIIDYKTGGIPTQAEVKSGYEPQLSLLAMIAEQGGFRDIGPKTPMELAYWQLTGGKKPAKEQVISAPPAVLAADAKTGLEQLIEKFNDPETPYQAVPKPRLQPRYDDYAHLARLQEWGRTVEDE